MTPDLPPSQTASEATVEGTVLVVDDESKLVGMYASMLEDAHVVRTATSGEVALDRLTDDVDVVLLDRRMPDLSGDHLLKRIRECGYDCRVAMVTSVEPDDDDILDLPFDAYLVKPVRQRDLREIVENLLLCSRCSSDIQEVFSIVSRLAVLEAQSGEEELVTNERYQELCDRKDRLEAANRERIAELTDRGNSRLVFRDVLGDCRNDT